MAVACTFNGTGSSDPDGSIASYGWNFGDSATGGSGSTPSHTFASGGTYTVMLTVTDNQGATGSVSHGVAVSAANIAPTAAFTSSCVALACTFNGTGSSDPDGSIASYAWNFGDSAAGSGSTPSHTFASGGTYAVTLTVTDNQGATGTASQPVTVSASQPKVHVGDLDGSTQRVGKNWKATVTITVHGASEQVVAGATVTGTWSGGTSGFGSCTTGTSGTCSIATGAISGSQGGATFTVTGVSSAGNTYDPTLNHDPDGDSTGTNITIARP